VIVLGGTGFFGSRTTTGGGFLFGGTGVSLWSPLHEGRAARRQPASAVMISASGLSAKLSVAVKPDP